MVEHLKDAARGSSRAHGHRSRQALVVAEVALSVALLIGAALLLSSFLRLQNTDGGFESEGVAASYVSIPLARYATPARQVQFFEEVVAALRAEPGVTGAVVSLSLPLAGGARTHTVAGRPVPPGRQLPLFFMNIVGHSYFELLGIPLVAGRAFDSGIALRRSRLASSTKRSRGTSSPASRRSPGVDHGQRLTQGRNHRRRA
jgi:hypothetical protein